MNKKIRLLLSLFLLFLFILLSKYEDRAWLRNLDFAVTTKIQYKIDHMSQLRLQRVVDNTMEGATFFASPALSAIIVLILTLLVKKNRFVIPVMFLLLIGGEIVGKSIVHHPSPPFSMIKHTTSVFPANYINEQFSYPSGHAARAVFLAILSYFVFRISYFGKKNMQALLAIGLFGYVTLVCISRIYIGHHWFSDVVGGLLLGSSLGVLTWVSVPPYNTRTMSD